MRKANPTIRPVLSRLRRKDRQIEAALFRKTIVLLTFLAAGIIVPTRVPGMDNDFDPWKITTLQFDFNAQINQSAGTGSMLPAMLPVLLPIDPVKIQNEQQQGFISIRGYLINFSGGEIDFGTEILLTIFNGDQVLEYLTVHLQPDQSFDFSLIPYSPDWTYVVSYDHNGIEFSSESIDGSLYNSGSTVNTKIWVFDSTSNPSLLRGEGMHVSLIFREEGMVHIVESMLFYNPSSMVIVPAGSESPVILFPLTEGSSSLTFLDNEANSELREVQGGFGDWQMIYPGTVHQVLFEYDLPFDGNSEFEFFLPMHMESIMVIVQEAENKIACSNPLMSQQIGNLAKPPSVINGLAQNNETSVIIHCVDRHRVLAWFLGVSGLLLVGLILFVILQRKKSKTLRDIAESPDIQHAEILDAIIALEDQFKAGELSPGNYAAKRAELVRKLESDQTS